MKKFVIAALAVMLLSTTAMASAPYYVRGVKGDWGTTYMMADDFDGTHSLTIDVSDQTAGDVFEFKCADENWTEFAPPNNNVHLRYTADDITFHFIPNAPADGWNPAGHRVGWDSTTGWDVMGDFNGWAAPYAMTDMGGGLYQVDIAVTTGAHEFKFRATDDWEINVGQTFSWNDANATMDAWADETHRFEIDVPNGRWRTSFIPEPATFALLGFGGLVLLRRRR
ncbi:MAG: PEP-CTERM sorting domain-containing protein [Planctomycetota bacterium]